MSSKYISVCFLTSLAASLLLYTACQETLVAAPYQISEASVQLADTENADLCFKSAGIVMTFSNLSAYSVSQLAVYFRLYTQGNDADYLPFPYYTRNTKETSLNISIASDTSEELCISLDSMMERIPEDSLVVSPFVIKAISYSDTPQVWVDQYNTHSIEIR